MAACWAPFPKMKVRLLHLQPLYILSQVITNLILRSIVIFLNLLYIYRRGKNYPILIFIVCEITHIIYVKSHILNTIFLVNMCEITQREKFYKN